jgi:hypothetical protein
MDVTHRDDHARRTPLAALRRLARPPEPVQERCELCSAPLAPEHVHLLELKTRQMVCSCEPCALLFTDRQAARYRRIPQRIEFWPDFRISDAQWEGLHIPIHLAFIYYGSEAQRVVAMYPSPAGATESLLTLDTWQELVAENPQLAELEPDVEALLVNRTGVTREYYRVPIDECYKLVGLIRTHWRGLSGGTEVWRHITQFFAALKQRSAVPKGASHA